MTGGGCFHATIPMYATTASAPALLINKGVAFF